MGDGFSVPVYLLHPMVVHFPIALLVLGLAGGLWSETSSAPAWLRPALPWTLWGGTAFLWLALALGLLAEHAAPHVPAAWKVLAAHKQQAWITAFAFSALCLARVWAKERGRRWILAAWALALASLVFTAHLGAQLVYVFGLGSSAP